MTLTINSNIFVLRTERSLAENGKELNRVFNQLSSGQRITKASDDAAGLAIADTLNAKSRIFTQGTRNLNDGISVISVADSALSSLTDITIRLKELAEQSANGVYSDKQRKALDAEAQALSKEFARVTKTTSFNGLNLFDGTVQGLRLQAGTGIEGSISSSLGGTLGTGGFTNTSTFSTGSNASQIVTGDLNGDGIVDLVTSDSGTNSLSIFIGKGDGTYKARLSMQTGLDPRALALGDLNGDGFIDLISADYGSGTVSVFLGRGDGTFANRTTISGVGAATTLNIGDLNGDGFKDLVVGAYDTSEASIFLGQGNGIFRNRLSVQLNANTIATAIGDLNGDGFDDLISADYQSTSASVRYGRGDGTFWNGDPINNGISSNSIIISDFNNDGYLDVVMSSGGDNDGLFLNRGDGSFSYKNYLETSGETLTSGDFNNDGYLDLVSTNGASSTVLLNHGDGTFVNNGVLPSAGAGKSVATADLNGDGVLDLISTRVSGSAADVLLGTTKDGVSTFLQFSLASKANSLQAISIFDNKLRSLSSQRGTLGAFQSRLETATNLLQSETENFKAAESRIRDVDVASASAELARRNILQQVAVSVLSQANQQPQLALKLLKD